MGAEGKTKEMTEAEISTAMRARVSDFKDKADSLTLEGVRRVLEKDLGLKTFALDVHKKFIKQCLEKYFYDTTELDVPKSSEVNAEKSARLKTVDEKTQHDNLEPTNKPENPITETDREKGLPPPAGKEMTEQEAKDIEGIEGDSKLGEGPIAKAIKRRATYFRDNSASITMSEVRRLLEEDLKLGKKALDSHKTFIRKQLEEVLTTEVVEPRKEDKKNSVKKATPSTNKSKGNKESVKKNKESEDFEDLSYQSESHGGSDAEEAKPKKRSAKEIKTKVTKVSKRQKISTKESKQSSYGRKKQAEPVIRKSSDSNGGNASEDDHSHSSVEEDPKKKRDNQTSSYGKQVEALKSIIKSCGMGVPPSIYKRVKQAPESEREAFLIGELEGILEREGLCSNPSEKEMKLMRKQKERAKELEGIDMNNIVSSSRRRTASSFIPPKPQIPVPSESEEEEEEEEEEDNSDEENSNGGVSSEGSEEDAVESD